MNRIILKPGREKSLLRRHPWIFSGAVAKVEGEPAAGETVEVYAAKGTLLGKGAWSPASQLVCRMWNFDPAEPIDRAFFERRIRAAMALRQSLGYWNAGGGCRLIASEADELPGWIVDRFGDFLVMQIVSAGAEAHRDLMADLLLEITGCTGIYERSDVSVRRQEGLPERAGHLRGADLPERLTIVENGVRFLVDARHGHKTGFYLDQRENRALVQSLAAGKTVLNCFAYTGGFGVAAMVGGADHVVNLDSSAPALSLAAENMAANGIAPDRYENRTADVFEALREYRNTGRKFDIVILDPPKFVDSKGSLPRGCRAYQDIARLGFQVLNPGGTLLTFSCSGLMTAELFQKITADAAVDAGVRAVIVKRLAQAADHPTALAVPENFYLKGLAVRLV